jgi:hypothetical protein
VETHVQQAHVLPGIRHSSGGQLAASTLLPDHPHSTHQVACQYAVPIRCAIPHEMHQRHKSVAALTNKPCGFRKEEDASSQQVLRHPWPLSHMSAMHPAVHFTHPSCLLTCAQVKDQEAGQTGKTALPVAASHPAALLHTPQSAWQQRSSQQRRSAAFWEARQPVTGAYRTC